MAGVSAICLSSSDRDALRAPLCLESCEWTGGAGLPGGKQSLPLSLSLSLSSSDRDALGGPRQRHAGEEAPGGGAQPHAQRRPHLLHLPDSAAAAGRPGDLRRRGHGGRVHLRVPGRPRATGLCGSHPGGRARKGGFRGGGQHGDHAVSTLPEL